MCYVLKYQLVVKEAIALCNTNIMLHYISSYVTAEEIAMRRSCKVFLCIYHTHFAYIVYIVCIVFTMFKCWSFRPTFHRKTKKRNNGYVDMVKY